MCHQASILLGDTYARFVCKPFILMRVTDGVEREIECEAKLGRGWHALRAEVTAPELNK